MHPELKAHPAYFEKEVVQLADNVYQAFGFAASNVYMIIGDDGLIIVDTSETMIKPSSPASEGYAGPNKTSVWYWIIVSQ